MSSRYDWSRETKINNCIELQQRNICRTAQKDMSIICLVCGRKPKHKEQVYQPLQGFDPKRGNIVLGHKDCIDREVAQAIAKIPAVAHSSTTVERSLTSRVGKPRFQNAIAPSSSDELSALSSHELLERITGGLTSSTVTKEVKQELYEKGWHDALAKVAVVLKELGIEI